MIYRRKRRIVETEDRGQLGSGLNAVQEVSYNDTSQGDGKGEIFFVREKTEDEKSRSYQVEDAKDHQPIWYKNTGNGGNDEAKAKDF